MMMTGWQIELLLDDVARAAAAAPARRSLFFDAPVVSPHPDERRLVHAAIAHARADGERVPAFGIVWRVWIEGAPPAATLLDGSAMVLAVGRPPIDLANSTFHELKHVVDFQSGRAFTPGDLEVRAVRFQRRMMQTFEGW